MNKKLIAIAVASVMAAPVAMADIKISGRVGLHYTVKSDDAVADDVSKWNDAGQTRLQFDGTSGMAYARIALDERLGRDKAVVASYKSTKRDNYVGLKFDNGMTLQGGRMGGVAKNLEKDPYIGTFLQTRGTAAESITGGAYGSSSFIDNVVQLSMKAGAVNVKIQYDLSDNASDNAGHTGIGISGKSGAVNYWASYNNAEADGSGTLTTSQSNIKVGAAMKLGQAKVSLNYTTKDDDTVNGSTNSILLMADMGFGNGVSGNAAIAVRSGDVAAQDATYMRLAVMKKLNKGASVYAGYTTTDNDTANTDTSELGLGMIVKF